jgi:hypothetical protein
LLEWLRQELEARDRVTGTYLLTDAGSAAETFYLGRGFHRSGRKVVLSAGPPKQLGGCHPGTV